MTSNINLSSAIFSYLLTVYFTTLPSLALIGTLSMLATLARLQLSALPVFIILFGSYPLRSRLPLMGGELAIGILTKYLDESANTVWTETDIKKKVNAVIRIISGESCSLFRA